MSNSHVLCTICARGGSKEVKGKNIKPILGKPLIAYSIEQAKESGLFEYIVVSTDSDEIAGVAKEYGAEVFFKRDANLASDKAGKLEVIRDAFVRSEAHYATKFDYLVDLDATSPLRLVEDITQSFQKLILDKHCNLITAAPSRRSPYFNLVEVDKSGKVSLSKKLDAKVKRRQDTPKSYDMNASIYVWDRDTILNKDSLFLDNTGLYIMPEDRSIDIDSALDYKIVELMMRERL